MARLEADGIKTPQLSADPQAIRQRFGVVLHARLELRRVSCLPLELVTLDRKSIVCSRSFGWPIVKQAEVAEAVTAFTSRAAVKMRRQGLGTAHLSVFVPGE